MATIVTRAGKGSALTWTEGDDNIINLNNDKLENVSEDTTPQLGGDLDVNNFKITSTNGNDITIDSGNKLYIGDLQWPYMPPTSINGTVTLVDTNRNPNVLQLSNIGAIGFGSTITFTGTDVTAVGLTVGTEYQVMSIVNGNQIELEPLGGGGAIAFTPLANPTDFNYSSSVSTVPNNTVLTHNSGVLSWALAGGGGAWTTNQNASGFELQNVVLTQYREKINDLGTTDTPSLSTVNGNVFKVTISSQLELNNWASQAGESITVFVTGNGNLVDNTFGNYKFASGNKALAGDSVVTIFYDGSTYWTSVSSGYTV